MKRMFAGILCAVLLAVPCRAERVPILMYHDISEARTGDYSVTPVRFEEHLAALENAGYHTVTFADLMDYVYFGGNLPDSPVLLTFDDGYDGVLTFAAEIAARHGMTAAGVERSLRLCVESTWMHGSLSALERFFGNSVDPERGKPTNREFLCRVQERLALAMQRLV